MRIIDWSSDVCSSDLKETVTNYEGFVRASTLAGRLRIKANIFFNDYRGLQLPFDVNPDPVIGSFVIRNAERATTYGAEVEARFKALKGLELFANAGLLATKVNRYDDPTVQGNDLPRSPARKSVVWEKSVSVPVAP